MLDQVLLPLADLFESGIPNQRYGFNGSQITEYESLRECLAELVAEGSVLRDYSGNFQFSPTGYAKYAPRIEALRTLKS